VLGERRPEAVAPLGKTGRDTYVTINFPNFAAGVSLFYLARLMGTSVEQIDRTYGHLLPDSEEYLRGLLDAYDVARSELAEKS
jgi:hypothetical protein